MEELAVWAVSAFVVSVYGWLAWLTRTHYADRKEMQKELTEVGTQVTVLDNRDYLTYRTFVEELDKRLAPLTEMVTAIAVHENVAPDRRKK